jgi:predicted ATPase
LQLALGTLHVATHGFASPEVENAFRRARELCNQTGDKTQVFPVLCGMVGYHAMRAEYLKARELAEEVFRIAQEAQNPDLLIEAHYHQGHTLIWIGQFPAALTHVEQGIALYDPQKHRSHAALYGSDPSIGCRAHAMQALWLLGYPDQALVKAKESLALTQNLSHTNSVAYGLATLVEVHQHRREWSAAQERGEAALAFAAECGIPYFAAQISIMLGSALAGQGRYEEGITKMRHGLAAQRATGGRLSCTIG